MSTTTAPRLSRTPDEISAAGMDALVDALGIADAARFLQQHGLVTGDYTAERGAWADDLSLEEVLRLMRDDASSRPNAPDR